ncbi:MAG: 4Fe-4S dicluster domain-containing protein [Pyrobaculum sp.]|mgnify:FL=1|jgi:Fe-S oxidoreductase|uniref:(Fe-S)-binding protein n=1 Tax=unclassified Pyrobaculum TaxID=2643434 RepID=UPI0021D8EDE3|nr:(Fe-S)-binding protein [Pyrobaculum sp. 3827-6]MCU7788496.1 (Fe-S)-binding protein [Pyrobaculum sp. 3827-6]
MIEKLVAEASKCQFCGFCEFACPTYRAVRMRHFGPRGRINIIKNFEGKLSDEALRGVLTCLACGACDPQCPAGIRITETIRAFKAFIIQQRLGL